MIRTKSRLFICLSLLCLNLAFIWGNSLLPGEISGVLSDWLKSLLSPLFGWEEGAPGGGGLLRKLAHFTEFLTLGLCLRWLWGMMIPKLSKQLLCSLGAAFITACIDETIQMFVPDRGPGIKDVLIDTAGAVLGITILTLIHYQKIKSKHLEENKL